MGEYIDREKIFPNGVFYVNGNNPETSLNELINRICNLPTADVVEVVRCKDCEYWRNTWHDPITNYDYGVCLCDQWEYKGDFASTTSNDFCSYGARKKPNE